MRTLRALAGLAVGTTFVVAGCGDPDAAVPIGAPVEPLTCDDDLAEIVELLRTELVTYDFDPAADLADLAGRADVVVAGPIDRLSRSDDGETLVVESSGLTHVGPDDVAAPATRFDVEARWSQRDEPDPLAEPVEVEGVVAVAFLFSRGDGRMATGPQGLAIGCAGADVAAAPVIEPLPADAAAMSTAELVDALAAIFDHADATPPAPPPDGTETTQTTGAGVEPLWQQAPIVELSVDGVALTEILLGFETWDGETQHPAEPEPAVGLVVEQGAGWELAIEHPAAATTTLHLLGDDLRFAEHSVVDWAGTEVSLVAPEPGTYFVDVRAEFGSSPAYAGTGVLRAGAWLLVTPPDASCDVPVVTPVFSPDSMVTGVVDADGCPVAAADASLDLDALTPWFHCAPWPPTLTWRTADADATMSRFWQYVDDPGSIAPVDLPGDAVRSGRFLPRGEVATAPSDPDAVFVVADDGTAERWSTPVEEVGCM